MSQQQEFIQPIESIELVDIDRLVARGRRLQGQAVGKGLNKLVRSLIPLRARRFARRNVDHAKPLTC